MHHKFLVSYRSENWSVLTGKGNKKRPKSAIFAKEEKVESLSPSQGRALTKSEEEQISQLITLDYLKKIVKHAY